MVGLVRSSGHQMLDKSHLGNTDNAVNSEWFRVFSTVFELDRVVSSTQKMFIEHETRWSAQKRY